MRSCQAETWGWGTPYRAVDVPPVGLSSSARHLRSVYILAIFALAAADELAHPARCTSFARTRLSVVSDAHVMV